MNKAGNRSYEGPGDIPNIIPVFPLSGALLLPGGNMPLNIFEKRYLALADDALSGDRLIGMIQPDLGGRESEFGPLLCRIGCLGRITGFQETGDGRYMINLTGICRFEVSEEIGLRNGYRTCRILVDDDEFADSGSSISDSGLIDRDLLLKTFRKYLEMNNMDTDWEAVKQTDDETLVTALCMMSPYGPAEKQALLEAADLNARAATLVAITEIELARNSDDPGSVLQ
jgi:Lon protease-like protein